MQKNKIRRYIPKTEANTNKEIFTCLQLLRQSWFPLKSRKTLRKLIDTGKIPAHLVNPNWQHKNYLIYKKDALKYANLKANSHTKSKLFKIGKDYFPVHAIFKQPWFPPKSGNDFLRLIRDGKIKAVNISTNPKLERYHVHKNEVIKFVTKRVTTKNITSLILKSLRAKRKQTEPA